MFVVRAYICCVTSIDDRTATREPTRVGAANRRVLRMLASQRFAAARGRHASRPDGALVGSDGDHLKRLISEVAVRVESDTVSEPETVSFVDTIPLGDYNPLSPSLIAVSG